MVIDGNTRQGGMRGREGRREEKKRKRLNVCEHIF